MLTEADAIGPYSPQFTPPFRVAIVSAQQLEPFQAVRVKFPDRDNIESWWLPIIQPKAQDDKVFWLPDIGEQVVVLMDEHDENGAVVGAIPSQVDTPPAWATADTFGVQFSDGTVLRYDRAAHVLTASVVSGGAATVSTGKGNQVVLDGNGDVTAQAANGGTAVVDTPAGNQVRLDTAGNVALTAGSGGKVTFSNGSVPGDALALVSKLVAAFNAHVHSDPQGGDTGAPTVQWTAGTIESLTTAVTD
ncbi:MAG: phage baseplate assembly protein V [Acetobacteraceae bacterium]